VKQIERFLFAQRATKHGVSTSGSGVRCEVSFNRRRSRECSAHPWASPAIVSGFSSGRFLDQWARVGPEALDQNPQAALCEELRLTGLAILLRRVSVHDE
jgi:hypothetical protein